MNPDPSNQQDGASGATLRLLRAAFEMSGGDDRLARRLQISPEVLAQYLSGGAEPPRHVMLRLVDLLLLERESGAGGPDATGGVA